MQDTGHRHASPEDGHEARTGRRRSPAVTLTAKLHRAPCWRIAEQDRTLHQLAGGRDVADRA